MSHDTKKLLALAHQMETLAIEEFVKAADTNATKARNEAKEKGLYYGWGGAEHGWVVGTESELKKKGVSKARKPDSDSNAAKDKKVDPKAKVRNRGTVCVPAESAKDKKDHFPINDEDQARNALSQVGKYKSAPPWYNGSLEGLKSLISRKVHSKYPSIGKSEKKKSSSLDSVDGLLAKYAQQPAPVDITNQINQAIMPFGYVIKPGTKPQLLNGQYVDVQINAASNAKWQGTGHQGAELKKIIDPITTQALGAPSKPVVSF
jgi:hypothetical protein